jgi:hypothetical protein
MPEPSESARERTVQPAFQGKGKYTKGHINASAPKNALATPFASPAQSFRVERQEAVREHNPRLSCRV